LKGIRETRGVIAGAQSSLRAALEALTDALEADELRRLAYDEALEAAELAAELIELETEDE